MIWLYRIIATLIGVIVASFLHSSIGSKFLQNYTFSCLRIQGVRQLMPIRPFLAGQAFQPETITDMSDALERVCNTLRVRAMDDAMNRVVAEKIIHSASAAFTAPTGYAPWV